MTNFAIEATARTPEVTFDMSAGQFVITGESYPEDVPSFFAIIHEKIEAYFAETANSLHVDIKLTYFNSSSARALMELLDLLDGEAGSGRQIDVKWHCDPDDDITREFAQDISSDASHIAVELCDLAPLNDS